MRAPFHPMLPEERVSFRQPCLTSPADGSSGISAMMSRLVERVQSLALPLIPKTWTMRDGNEKQFRDLGERGTESESPALGQCRRCTATLHRDTRRIVGVSGLH
ncbi:unnamed protein product [Arctogadus glacialis]